MAQVDKLTVSSSASPVRVTQSSLKATGEDKVTAQSTEKQYNAWDFNYNLMNVELNKTLDNKDFNEEE